MLPNMRLSGTANDSLNDFLAVSSASAVRSATATAATVAANNSAKNNAAATAAAASFSAANRSFAASVSSSGWGPLTTSASSTTGSTSFAGTAGGGQSRALSDHARESTGWSQQTNNATSMPWAAAVKVPIEQHHNQHSLLQHHSAALAAAAASLATMNAFGDNGNSIGSWTSPETSSSTRSGWNSDGSMKSDGIPDDGTAIWGNPSTKKTGIDWTEKESLLNPPQVNTNSEKRIQKSEPIISSINGTEAWGMPAAGNNSNSNIGVNKSNNNNSQQLANLSENSGNNFVGKTPTINNEPLSWSESSSLQQAANKNRNSSPTKDSVWNYLTSNNDSELKKNTSTDWLSSNVSANVSSSNPISRMDELSKQLEATSLFNGNSSASGSLLTKTSSSTTSNNPNLDNNIRQTSSMLVNSNSAGTIGAGLVGVGGVANSNAITDLKQQMSANSSSSNDLLDSSPIRQQQANAVLSSNNQTQSQLGAYSLGVTPSRELLKQMVHQIQLAVQAGHLNAHILNQPLSTPTLQLVYTLLQQIKLLQQFQEIQQRTQTVKKSGDISNHVAQQNNFELQINRVQHNISLLQTAITQQQAALTKNESLVESSLKQQQQQQQAANNNSSYNNSYANISKLSTNIKVPSNMSNTISNNSNMDSFRRSSLIDTLSNSNSDHLRSAAQATFEANANIDKNLSPILQSSASLSNILINKQQNDYTKHQTFTNNHNANQQAKGNLLSSTAQASTSPAAAAWLSFTQGGDIANLQSGSVGSGWSRLSSQQEQPQFNSDILSELSAAKAWRDAFLSSDVIDNAPNLTTSASSSMAPGSNLARPNSASSNLKQMSENDVLNRDLSLYYDWTSSNQTSDSTKRNFDATAASSSFSSAISGLSLQSNPWLFAPTSSDSLNIGSSGLDNLIGSNKNSAKNKSDNGNTDKMRVGADPLGFLSSNSSTGKNSQRAIYDWGDITPVGASSLHYNNENNPIGSNKQTATSSSALGSRPAPPPGLISNLGPLGTSSMNEVSSILESDNNRQSNDNEAQMVSRESSSSLWSGAWFD